MSVESDTLPPVPQHVPPLIEQGATAKDPKMQAMLKALRFDPAWMRWFLQLAKKANVINGAVLGPSAGGTGISSYVTGDILYATSSTTLTRLPIGGAGQVLTVTGGVPVWSNTSGGMGLTRDTWALRPASPSSPAQHLITDAPSVAYYLGTTWYHYIGTTEVTPPVLANFTQINWGTSSTATFGPFTSIIPQAAVAYNFRILTKTAPATPYNVECGILMPSNAAFGAGVGFLLGAGFRQSSDGKLHIVFYDSDGNALFRNGKFASPTSLSATYFSLGINPASSRLIMLRIRDDGTNRYIYAQQGDYSWQLVSTVLRTDFLTADQVCIAVNIQSTVLADRVHWVHWKEY